MKERGFVAAVKARDKYFFYVRVSYRDQNKKPRNKNLMGLGQKENALFLLNSWIENENSVPDNMKNYDNEHFKKWIEYVESK